MNITEERNDQLTSLIHVQLTPEDYTAGVDKRLAEYRRKATMPGFRPGKVPMGLVKKMYGRGVLAEEVNKVVSESLNQYILENKLNVLGYPLPNQEKNKTIDFEKQEEFDFYFDIGLAPEFEIELKKEIKVPYYKVEIEDSEVDKALEDVKVRFGTEENPEAATASDALQGIFREMAEDGSVLENGHQHSGYFKLEDLSDDTVRKEMTGKKAGDKIIFNLMKSFEDESKVRSLLHLHEGSEDKLQQDYELEIEKVVRFQEAELNEELFQKVYPNSDVKTLEEFREKIREELQKHRENDTDKQFMMDTIQKLIEITNLELPDDFMKRWILESNEGKITSDQLEEQYDSYVRSMQWQLIESKLREKFGEDLTVSEEEIRDKIRNYFQPANEEGQEKNPQIEQIIDRMLENKEEKQRIHSGIQDEKYIRFFKDKLTLDEKQVNAKELYEIASNTKF